jgi:hypothetical protein
MAKKRAKKRATRPANAARTTAAAKVRTKSRTKGRTKVSKAAGRDSLDQFIDAAAQALALPVEPAWRPAVRFNLEVTLYAAGLLADFPLPDDAEPAPVFAA